ncbi:hypothetical protein LUW74_17965 [Actinomadura madurae]|uniref:hypothetical protein n=1 Tax=Actinomadura madurae TaxID=1993 RepID=UPI00202690E0|nr:hypothetical protein [Actinomadura madurae]URN05019.1 hypothetical protein LUW74_17965 [Actinomadura madurae]
MSTEQVSGFSEAVASAPLLPDTRAEVAKYMVCPIGACVPLTTHRTDAVAEMAFAVVPILASRDPLANHAGLHYSEFSDWIFVADPDLEARWREISGAGRMPPGCSSPVSEHQAAERRMAEQARPQWWPTGLGRAALDEYPDPVSFYDEALKAYQYWSQNKDWFKPATDYAEGLPGGQIGVGGGRGVRSQRGSHGTRPAAPRPPAGRMAPAAR